MKKLILSFIFSAVLLSCGKEVQVTRDHPVTADFEATEAFANLPVAWFDLRGTSVLPEALDEALKDSPAKVALLILPAGFGGGAEAWLASAEGSWPCAGSSAGLLDGDSYVYICAAGGAAPHAVPVGEKSVMLFSQGKFSIILGLIGEEDAEALLQKTWFANAEQDWIYALGLGEASATLEAATFLDCLQEMFTGASLPPVRSDWLYTSAGTWNCLKGLSLGKPGFSVSFTINAEESRL